MADLGAEDPVGQKLTRCAMENQAGRAALLTEFADRGRPVAGMKVNDFHHGGIWRLVCLQF